jgi:hypothetical protein
MMTDVGSYSLHFIFLAAMSEIANEVRTLAICKHDGIAALFSTIQRDRYGPLNPWTKARAFRRFPSAPDIRTLARSRAVQLSP